MQDDKLLTQYARDGSEAAFGQLVARHLSLVYSTCLRETGSPSLAEDAAQVVFLLLARKARSLRAGPSLAGWLYRAARFVAKDVRKQEQRRRQGEERVMQEVTHRPEPFIPEWERVEPFLNDALSALKAGEREAVLLRFLEGHTLAETGAALGLSEDAARMRVSRAVEKMRRYLTAHGAAVTGIVLTGLLTSEAARPTPANAAAITQATVQALSTGPAANVLLLSKGVYQTMNIIKVKLAALAAVMAVGGAALPPLAHAISSHKTTLRPVAAPARLIKPGSVLPAPEPTSPPSKTSNVADVNDVFTVAVNFVDAAPADYKKANQAAAPGPHHAALLLDALVGYGAKDIKIPDVQAAEGVTVTKHVTTSVPFTTMEKGRTQHNFMDLDSFVQATPRSNGDGTITVTLQVQRASLISDGPPPKTATATISRTVTFRDGQTLVLGGRETAPTASTYHLIFVTVHSLKTPPHQALANTAPLTAQPASVPLDGPAIPVPSNVPAAQAAGPKTLFLQHTTPVAVLSLLRWEHPTNLPAGVTRVQSLPAQNALAVVATPAGLAKVREIVKILDIEPRQVQIKSAYAPASEVDLKASGVDLQSAAQTEPGLKPLSVTSGAGNRASRLLEALTQRGTVTQGPVITTTNDVQASISLSSTAPAQDVELLTFAATPRINSDSSITLTLNPVFTINKVRHEINTFRTVKSGDTMVLVMSPADPQADKKNIVLFVTPTILARSVSSHKANVATPPAPAPLRENVTTKFTLDKGQHAFYSATLPKGVSMLILDIQRTGGKVGDLRCSLSITDEDAARLRGSTNATGRLEAMDDMGTGRRITTRSVLKKSKPVLLDVRNQGGQCQYWLTILHDAPAVNASALEASPSASVPLFGAIVPTPMVLGETKAGLLAGNGNAYFLISLKAGRYYSFLDFSSAGGKSTELNGSLLLTDEEGFLFFCEAGPPSMAQYVPPNDLHWPNSPDQGRSKFTLERDGRFLVRVANQPDEVDHSTPVNFTARILPDSSVPAEKQN